MFVRTCGAAVLHQRRLSHGELNNGHVEKELSVASSSSSSDNHHHRHHHPTWRDKTQPIVFDPACRHFTSRRAALLLSPR
ncbi:hypothetical protein E2C01_003056 [Portunus trituberculatus]|uniref:Uncharacterized protein n=1 Tax=Portunus trituberculatus TaxID=210409 RepID=A0A5B7CNQ7_PORTR|nr:hypothetical protein [Portunus trituberculatus]